jgi:GNAT superfamily N-acetyltransferase
MRDFEGVRKLLQQLWPDMISNTDELRIVFERALTSTTQKSIAAIAEDDVVGFCSLTLKNSLWTAGNLGVIDELVVDTHHRGMGIGKNLIEKISLIAHENNCTRIELDSSFHREEAHRFYEKIGFVKRAYWFSKRL